VSNLLGVPSFEGRIRFAPQPIAMDDRKALALALHERVTEEHAILRRQLLAR